MRILAVIALLSAALSCSTGEAITFHDVKSQTLQFIEWDKQIQLTPQQEAVKKAALEALPAPCCSDNSAYTCCCPCNLSRSTWGLSKWLITEKGYSALQVKDKAAQWIAYIQPNGSSGKACYTGGCSRPFAKDGCGGMNPNAVQFE
ncbi:MAG: hypothetical protein R2748_10345 [Bryobacterales bacterium]